MSTAPPDSQCTLTAQEARASDDITLVLATDRDGTKKTGIGATPASRAPAFHQSPDVNEWMSTSRRRRDVKRRDVRLGVARRVVSEGLSQQPHLPDVIRLVLHQESNGAAQRLVAYRQLPRRRPGQRFV